MPRLPHHRPLLSVLVFAMIAGVALAQDVTGTITARMGGVERTWNTLGFDHPDGYQATASWSFLMDRFVSVSIQGHPGTSPQLEEALAIDVSTFDGFPTDCPCRIQQADVMYWSTSSMFEDVYIGTDAEVTFTVVEPLDDDTYRVEGSFSATLAYQARLGGPLDEGGDVLAVDGTFTVESLPRREVE
ncbi:MAG: hypothetical protein U5K81_10230 [Trueperaceae bacterium]|nr:hypothetical protein [Trueperaceae bacterium]